MPINDAFNPEREITSEQLDHLRSLGYLGDEAIESLMAYLNTIKPKYVDGKAWWIDFKDKKKDTGVSFIDAVYSEVEKELKK